MRRNSGRRARRPNTEPRRTSAPASDIPRRSDRHMPERQGLIGCLVVIVIIALIVLGAILFTSLTGG